MTAQPIVGSRTATKQAAQCALDQCESKYRRLVEGISSDYVIYSHDPDGTVTYISPSVENVLGFPASTIVGLNWRDLIGKHFIGRQEAERVRSEVDADKKFHGLTVEISHADGTTRLIEIQQRPLFDDTGKYISMEGVGKDVTETVRNAGELQRLKRELEYRVAERTAELSLKNIMLLESEQRYRNVVEDQTEFITRWLPGGKHTFANRAYCRYFEKTLEEVLGESFFPTVYKEDFTLVEQHIQSLTPQHSHATIRHRVYRPDGSVGWMEWTHRALFDDLGLPREYQSAGRDITVLMQAADTIREKEAHLAHVSRLATMGELVAGIAHEVHQPLHAAKTFSEAARRYLEAGSPDGITTAIECTKEISEAISRTVKIIRHLRDFTKYCPVEFESLELNALVQEAAEMISYETRRARVNLSFELCEDLPLIQGDRVQLEQACINLLMNAYEAMKETPVKDRLMKVSTNYTDRFARLVFRDSGCGVAVGDTARLFNAFYSTKTEGMGMGLSLCKSIAEAHGGSIWAEKNEGLGMTFVLSLSLANDVSPECAADAMDLPGIES
ncbi:MAG: PAS domain S-box protein [Pirellulales bacterium]|nr:PAS domain S-box protein [Pirellulales bacterium]